MSKTKKRRLWLKVLFKVPAGISKNKVKDTLLRSIESGKYELPSGWLVILQWRNKENSPMKSGPWRRELTASARSSDGFSKAVISYLEEF